MIDTDIGKPIAEGPPPTDPHTGLPIDNFLRIDGIGLSKYRQGLTRAEVLRLEAMEHFMKTLGYRGGEE